MAARPSQTAAPGGLSPARSVTRAPRRIDMLGSAALTIAVVGSSLIVYLLHPGAAPGDSRQPGELPSSVQTHTYDDWARATPVSPDPAPIGTAGTFVCETSASPDWVYVADLDDCIPARW